MTEDWFHRYRNERLRKTTETKKECRDLGMTKTMQLD